MDEKYLKYYSRKDVQFKIMELGKDREVAPRYNEGFGKRPDIIQFPGDIEELARKGATSFHVSEERWRDPLELKPGMSKKELDENRIGWDLILDIDTVYWDYAKLTAYYLIEALKFHDIKNISVKFSGSKGFHLGIPFESFPDEVNGVKTKDLFPESLRVIALYLQEMIRPMLVAKILEKTNISDLVSFTGKKKSELVKNGVLDPFEIIDIDTVLISNRHLFRSAYSMHEKTGLVSIPIDPNNVLKFEKKYALPEKVKTDRIFLDRNVDKNEGSRLIIQAFDWYSRQNIRNVPQEKEEREYKLPTTAISEEFFPYCITKILEGKQEDGKKRSLFILCNFLRKMGWNWIDIEKKIKEWNEKNPDPLKEAYLKGQINWNKKRKEAILPPNCNNSMYYKDLRICCNSDVCLKYKNPVNFALRQSKLKKVKKRSKK
ncbi:MAG: DNA primase small subunit domain-containing protein [archaeon]